MIEHGISVFTLMKNEDKLTDLDGIDPELIARLKFFYDRFTKVLKGYNKKVEQYKNQYLAVLKAMKKRENQFYVPWLEDFTVPNEFAEVNPAAMAPFSNQKTYLELTGSALYPPFEDVNMKEEEEKNQDLSPRIS